NGRDRILRGPYGDPAVGRRHRMGKDPAGRHEESYEKQQKTGQRWASSEANALRPASPPCPEPFTASIEIAAHTIYIGTSVQTQNPVYCSTAAQLPCHMANSPVILDKIDTSRHLH